jgi:hypothetical protein
MSGTSDVIGYIGIRRGRRGSFLRREQTKPSSGAATTAPSLLESV